MFNGSQVQFILGFWDHNFRIADENASVPPCGMNR